MAAEKINVYGDYVGDFTAVRRSATGETTYTHTHGGAGNVWTILKRLGVDARYRTGQSKYEKKLRFYTDTNLDLYKTAPEYGTWGDDAPHGWDRSKIRRTEIHDAIHGAPHADPAVVLISDYDKGEISQPSDVEWVLNKYPDAIIVVETKSSRWEHKYARYADRIDLFITNRYNYTRDAKIPFKNYILTDAHNGFLFYYECGNERLNRKEFSALCGHPANVVGAGDCLAAVAAKWLAWYGRGYFQWRLAPWGGAHIIGDSIARMCAEYVSRPFPEFAFLTVPPYPLPWDGPDHSLYKFVDEIYREDPWNYRKRLDEQRERGRKVVFTNGCFDMLHYGHINLFTKIREKYRDCYLIAAVDDDESVRALKGEGRPIESYFLRATRVAKYADAVTVLHKDKLVDLITFINPDVLVKGSDHPQPVGAREVLQEGGEVWIVERTPGVSTTELIAAGENGGR